MITERPVPGRPPGLPKRPAAEAARTETRRDALAIVRAYIALTKPRIVELLLITTIPAMMLAAGGWPELGLTVVVLVGGALAAGAASALNCYIDRDIDQLMRRTKRRPLPAHSVTPRAVLIFGFTLAAISLVLMGAFTNWLATALTEAAHPAEHLLGWHLRRRPGDHRMGRGDRFGVRDGLGAFRDCFLLADAAFLRIGH